MNRNRVRTLLPVLLACSFLWLGTACSRNPKPAQESDPRRLGGSLVLKDIRLEQSDVHGHPLWQIWGRQVVYSHDQQIAHILAPHGQIFQDGKVAYLFTALRGKVLRNGKMIQLFGRVVITQTKDGARLRGDEGTWLPAQDQMTVTNHVVVTHPQFSATAQQARLFNRTDQMILTGNVLGITKQPPLHIHTNSLTWAISTGLFTSNEPTRVDHYQGDNISDWAQGNQAQVNLRLKQVQIANHSIMTLGSPPITIQSPQLTWNVDQKTLVSDQPLQVTQRLQGITMHGDTGQMDLNRHIVYLQGNVHGFGQANHSVLTSDQFTWNVPQQAFVATGHVVYNQQHPTFESTGPQAIGKFQGSQVVFDSAQAGTAAVVTHFNPNQ